MDGCLGGKTLMITIEVRELMVGRHAGTRERGSALELGMVTRVCSFIESAGNACETHDLHLSLHLCCTSQFEKLKR